MEYFREKDLWYKRCPICQVLVAPALYYCPFCHNKVGRSWSPTEPKPSGREKLKRFGEIGGG